MSKKNFLGRKLRDIRRSRGLTGTELAGLLNYSQSGVSRIESGKTVPSISYIENFCLKLNLAEEVQKDLVVCAGQFLKEFYKWRISCEDSGDMPFANGWSNEQLKEIPSYPLQREKRATLVEDFQLSTIPGLLQTESYASAIFLIFGIKNGEYLSQAIDLRMKRQQVLVDGSKRFHFVLSEAALLNGAFSAEVMAEQIVKLEKIARLPNVELLVLPLATPVRSHSVTSFSMYDRKLTVLEGLAQELSIWTDTENAMYAEFFDKLRQDAVPLDQLNLIERQRESRGERMRPLPSEGKGQHSSSAIVYVPQ